MSFETLDTSVCEEILHPTTQRLFRYRRMRGIQAQKERTASLNPSPFVGDLEVSNDALLWTKQLVWGKLMEDRRWVLLALLGVLQWNRKQKLNSVMKDTHEVEGQRMELHASVQGGDG